MQEKLQIDQAMLPRRHKAPRQFEMGLSQRLSRTTFGLSIMLLLMQPCHVLDSGSTSGPPCVIQGSIIFLFFMYIRIAVIH